MQTITELQLEFKRLNSTHPITAGGGQYNRRLFLALTLFFVSFACGRLLNSSFASDWSQHIGLIVPILKYSGIAVLGWFAMGHFVDAEDHIDKRNAVWFKIKSMALSDQAFVDSYNPTPLFPTQFYKSSPLMPKRKIDRWSARDHITGNYKGIKYEILAIKTSRIQFTGKRRTMRNRKIYNGILLTVPFEKAVLGDTVITTDNSEFIFGGSADNEKPLSLGGNELRLIKMHHPKFESSFTVRTSNRTEAHWILSTDFMERLLDVKFQLESQIQARFNNTQMRLSIPIYTGFLDARRSMDADNDQIEKLRSDVLHILGIIDALRL